MWQMALTLLNITSTPHMNLISDFFCFHSKPTGSKTVIFAGQDEAIFKQFLFLTKIWVGPSGERPLLPKDEGTGTMMSTFICCDHGLLREISAEILAKVNAQRAGQKNADQDAVIEILGSANKRLLTLDKSPFLVFFEYGENWEGYCWAYNNMVLQFDVLQVMHDEPIVWGQDCSNAKYNYCAGRRIPWSWETPNRLYLLQVVKFNCSKCRTDKIGLGLARAYDLFGECRVKVVQIQWFRRQRFPKIDHIEQPV